MYFIKAVIGQELGIFSTPPTPFRLLTPLLMKKPHMSPKIPCGQMEEGAVRQTETDRQTAQQSQHFRTPCALRYIEMLCVKGINLNLYLLFSVSQQYLLTLV
jgi:hypothetical protein